MYQKSILENGIRVVTEAMPSVRSVSMGIIVDAGLRDEVPQKNGQAHAVEHLMFQGTTGRDAMQIARLMDEAGGRIGGFTTRDYTCYSATVLDDYRTYALELLGDILLNSIFRPEDVEREKKAILSEIDALYDLPEQRVDNLLKAHLWKGQPLGMPIAGKHETVSAMTREDIVSFYETNYLPDRLIVAAAGNLDHQDIVAQVRDAFWRMLGQPRPVAAHPLEYHAGMAVEQMPVSQVYFSIGIRAFPFAHPDRYALHILNKILGDGISSRLFRRIREEQGLVYDIGSEYHAYQDGGLLVVGGSTKPACFQQVLGQVLTVTSHLISGLEPAKPDEFLRAKNQMKGQHIIAAEDPNTCMSRLATQELYFGKHISTAEIVERIDAVTIESLDDIARKGLAYNFTKAALAVVGPNVDQPYDALAGAALRAALP